MRVESKVKLAPLILAWYKSRYVLAIVVIATASIRNCASYRDAVVADEAFIVGA